MICEPCFLQRGAVHEAIICLDRRYLRGGCAKTASARQDWLGILGAVLVFILTVGVLLK